MTGLAFFLDCLTPAVEDVTFTPRGVFPSSKRDIQLLVIEKRNSSALPAFPGPPKHSGGASGAEKAL